MLRAHRGPNQGPGAAKACGLIGDINDLKSLQIARDLIETGADVRFLHVGEKSPSVSSPPNLRVDLIEPNSFGPGWNVPGPNRFARFDLSDWIRLWLDKEHRWDPFETIRFLCSPGLAFRTRQAQELGWGFEGVTIETSKGQGTSVERWPNCPEDLAWAYCKRRGQFEQASSLPHESPTPLVTACVPFYNLADTLNDTLVSIAKQTHSNLDVIVINDGSTDERSRIVFRDLQARYPAFRFFEQANAGIGATRNRGIELAKGEYFLPVDADNILMPDAIARFAAAMERRPDLAAVSCYFLAFAETCDIDAERFLYAFKPLGGPRGLAPLQNVYGDACTLFRTEALRSMGGFSTDRDASWEDWELFVKMDHAGLKMDVLPDFLFYYRHLEAGFSRNTSAFKNHRRVLRQMPGVAGWNDDESRQHWAAFLGQHLELERLRNENEALKTVLGSRRHRLAETVHRGWKALSRGKMC